MGTDPGPLLEETAQLLFAHSLFNGHPRFFGYITAPPAPIGILGDFLAAALNPNAGAWTLSPAATEIESQTVRWIAELIGYPVPYPRDEPATAIHPPVVDNGLRTREDSKER